jgi:hypothetical protein
VDPVPDLLLLRKSGSAGNRTRDFWICSQELSPLDHRGGHINIFTISISSGPNNSVSIMNTLDAGHRGIKIRFP